MTSFKWWPCSGTGRSVGCNRLVLSRDLITECQLLLQMHIYQIDILIRCAILVIKPNRKTIQQGFVQYQGWRLQTFNDIMILGYALLKYYHFLYYHSSLKNISIKKSIYESFSLSEVSCFWLTCGPYKHTVWLTWNETQMHTHIEKKKF